MRERLKRVSLVLTIILIIGIAYGVWVSQTNIAIPCLFHLVTGFDCPGCGITRMCVSLLRLDFEGAFRANMIVLILMPFFFCFGARHLLRYLKTGDHQNTKTEDRLSVIAIGLLLLWGILRNFL